MITNVKAVTVFNGRTEKETRRKQYIPTVIYGVSYVEAKGSTVTNNGVWSDDVQYKIRIPLSAVVQDGREFIPELSYEKLNQDEDAKYWTISKGDLVVRGEYSGESILLYEDEIAKYAQGQGMELIRVKEYADNTSGGSQYLKHWRIGGK